jgi:hypothetical protein
MNTEDTTRQFALLRCTEVIMNSARSTCCIGLVLSWCLGVASAQSGTELQVSGGAWTASFTTAQGRIQVFLPSDAAPGDTISGLVIADPAGATPQQQQANLGSLTGLVVDLEGQQTKVASRQYEWMVPAALRAGRATLALRTQDGGVVSQVPVPIDPQPPIAPGPGATNVTLPADIQIGRPAIIRGRNDGRLRGKTVDVGGTMADLLAASPRQVIFRVTQSAVGDVPIRFTGNGSVAEGRVRALSARLIATSNQLTRGQRATLTTTVSGLAGITEPVILSFRNLSPAIVRLEGDAPVISIQPRNVRGDGTYVDTRRLTGVQAGGYRIVASVSRPALSRFNVTATINTVVDAWEVRARFRIAPDARDQIQRSVREARRPLEDFLRQQELNGADPQSVFQSLLAHYCYDLRDNQLSSNRSASLLLLPQPVMLTALRQQPARAAEVGASQVRRWSFLQFLSDLVARATSQSIGYLFVTSSPEQAGITIDGQRKTELTNRRFVTSVGTHDVQVAHASKPCRVNVTISALQTSVVSCD